MSSFADVWDEVFGYTLMAGFCFSAVGYHKYRHVYPIKERNPDLMILNCLFFVINLLVLLEGLSQCLCLCLSLTHTICQLCSSANDMF